MNLNSLILIKRYFRWILFVSLFVLFGCSDYQKEEVEFDVLVSDYSVDSSTVDKRYKRFYVDGSGNKFDEFNNLIPDNKDIWLSESDFARKTDYSPNDEGPIWLPPRVVTVGDEIEPKKTVLSVDSNSLIKVEIQTYSKIDCGHDIRDIKVAKDRPYLEPIAQERLVTYGEVVSTKYIWMVPGVIGGGEKTKYVQPDMKWLGIALQRVDRGQRVFFDASQNCATNIESLPLLVHEDALETENRAVVQISQMQPFTARIIEVCHLKITGKYRSKSSYNHVYAQRMGASALKVSLVTNCPISGVQEFNHFKCSERSQECAKWKTQK